MITPLTDIEVTFVPHRYTRVAAGALLATLLVALFAAAPALAGTVSVAGNTVTFADGSAPGAPEANAVTFKPTPLGTQVLVSDPRAELHAGPGCTQDSGEHNSATCGALTPATKVAADLGQGDDQAVDDLTGGHSASFNGGPGDDILTGNDAGDTLAGDDGADSLSGGAGDDTLGGGAGGDEIDGDAGTDTATYDDGRTSAVHVTLDGIGLDGAGCPDPATCERDNVVTENVAGGPGHDSLTGDDSANRLDGGDGDDRLSAAGGVDELNGDAGDDALLGGAGADALNGGDGIDTASYEDHQQGVTAELGDIPLATTTGGGAEDDGGDAILGDVENLTGGPSNDALTGSSGDNVLSGGAGSDTLVGGDGADELR
ncbi:MAG TPA: calcium-binding protein, partial [Solirubrobacteraceae bacterium]